MPPRISVCIPAYNKPGFLADVLHSVAVQNYKDFEIVVSEDHSPRAKEIEEVVNKVKVEYPHIAITLFLNEENLGYDENFRSLLDKAKGAYCVYMGDDDFMLPGALQKIGTIITEYKNVGIILRSWNMVDRDTGEIMETFKYFNSDRFFLSGCDSVSTLFRRSVALAGYTVHRESALRFSTDRFDGTTLYQLYLTLRVLLIRDGFCISEPYFQMRKAGNPSDQDHYFGSSKKEKGLFKPKSYSPEFSLNFMKGMIRIANEAALIENIEGKTLAKRIIRDIDNYSYPFMSMHRHRPGLWVFIKYVCNLVRIGFGRSPYFWVGFILLVIFGRSNSDKIIRRVKGILGRTPVLGGLYSGSKVKEV